MKKVILSTVIFFTYLIAFGQIVQPGQLEVLVYPGAQIDNIDQIETKINVQKEVVLFEDFRSGSICVNEKQCYENLQFNVDILNRNVALKKNSNDITYLSFTFLYSLKTLDNNNNYQLIKSESDNQPMLSEILFRSGDVVFYKKYFVKVLQADYRPEFDTGSKEPRFEKDFTYEFIDELGNQFSLNKINKRILKKSLDPKSAVFTQHIKSNKVKGIEDFIDALNKTY